MASMGTRGGDGDKVAGMGIKLRGWGWGREMVMGMGSGWGHGCGYGVETGKNCGDGDNIFYRVILYWQNVEQIATWQF